MRENRQSTFNHQQSKIVPRLALIADGFTLPARAERVEAAVEAGVPWVHLRDHAAPAGVFERAAEALVPRLRTIAPDVRLSVNMRLLVARRLGVGLHVGIRGVEIGAARKALGAAVQVGFSAHDLAEGRQALAAGADYLFFSPIFPTPSKPGRPGAGLDALATFCAALPATPVFALGGLTPVRVPDVLAAGAHGVAVLSGILSAEDPAAAVRAYREAIARSIQTSETIS